MEQKILNVNHKFFARARAMQRPPYNLYMDMDFVEKQLLKKAKRMQMLQFLQTKTGHWHPVKEDTQMLPGRIFRIAPVVKIRKRKRKKEDIQRIIDDIDDIASQQIKNLVKLRQKVNKLQ